MVWAFSWIHGRPGWLKDKVFFIGFLMADTGSSQLLLAGGLDVCGHMQRLRYGMGER
jgi:hypothetical protein